MRSAATQQIRPAVAVKWRRRALVAAGVMVAAIVLVEAGVRAVGAVDFPVYEVRDDDVAYVYAAQQSGRFLRRNAWAVNDRHMPTPRPWDPARLPNLLVIGNSIVAGGNPYDQSEKVASRVEGRTDGRYSVWPVAVGGWSTTNQIAFLEGNPDVVRASTLFVWVHTSGGLRGPNPWLGDDAFPRRRPAWATAYVLRRYLQPQLRVAWKQPPAPPRAGTDADASGANLVRFEHTVAALASASGRRHPGVLVLYPTRAQVDAARRGIEWLPERADLEGVAARYGVLVKDLTRHPEWAVGLYRDEIHPTVAGNEVLARIVVADVERALEE
jgi:hypothetical protein